MACGQCRCVSCGGRGVWLSDQSPARLSSERQQKLTNVYTISKQRPEGQRHDDDGQVERDEVNHEQREGGDGR